MLAVGAITEVALHQHDFFRNIDYLIGPAETDDIGDARIGRFVAVGRTHAAADSHIISDQLARFDDGNEGKAVCINVDVVGWRHSHRDLELTRQVGFAVDRLEILFGRFDLFAVEPDLVISTGLWREMRRNILGDLQRLRVNLGEIGIRVAHHIAVHVAARSDRVHRHLINLGDGTLQIALDDAVKLKGLTRGQLDSSVRELGSEAVGLQPLLRSGNSTRHADTDHEGISLLQLVLATVRAEIAIILLIGSVELEELLVVLTHRSSGQVCKPFGNRAAQVVAVDLDVFVRGEFLFTHDGRNLKWK